MHSAQTQTQTHDQIHIFNQDCRKVGQVYLSRLRSWKKKIIKNGDGMGNENKLKKEKKMIKGEKEVQN